MRDELANPTTTSDGDAVDGHDGGNDDDDNDDDDSDYVVDTEDNDDPNVTMQSDGTSEGIPETAEYSGGPAFSLIWDNTQKLVQARHQSRQSKNKMYMWANAYAALNRVDSRGFDDHQQTLRACDIPLSSFFPNSDDNSALRHRMAVAVSRILVEHVPFFDNYCQSGLVRHVPHRYSAESAVKTETVREKCLFQHTSTLLCCRYETIAAVLDLYGGRGRLLPSVLFE